ncbi:hypothetical protein KLF44_04445 [Clostridium perfringens]|uniref:hypothetical protein n=1 Tax=Clostridium perfringens TaxID=1502 RepID=UPI001CC94948|nr:hypothetical protein [Clostridium perfringens]UBK38668.1 hypothetical protein KLF44_04445 [Clostridium perfringens]UBK95504.1 hypothetical protein KLF49_04440 [Clostridium perfringens]
MNSLNILRKVRYLHPLISSILSLWLISYFNIVKYLTFIPEDNRFDVCLALYLTIIQILINLFDRWLQKKFEENLSEIEVIFYKDKNNKSINVNPTISFDKETGIGQVKCSVEMKGNTKLLSNTKLIIAFPNWVEAQPNLSECIVIKEENNQSINIYLSKFLTNIEIEEEISKIEFDIPMLINNISGHRENQIKCKFEMVNESKKNMFYLKKYIANNFKLIS